MMGVSQKKGPFTIEEATLHPHPATNHSEFTGQATFLVGPAGGAPGPMAFGRLQEGVLKGHAVHPPVAWQAVFKSPR